MKRYEYLLRQEKANEHRAKMLERQLFDYAEYVAEFASHRNEYADSISDDEVKALEQEAWSLHDEWLDIAIRVSRIESNLRKAHVSFCRVRQISNPMTLAEVNARYVNTKQVQHDPPGLCSSSNVLATCHASNAPGLFPTAMTYWQVRPLE
jgi:hypothetical protein